MSYADYNRPLDTDHFFDSDGYSPYCKRCELLSWMHDGPRMPKTKS